jgi:hypothetical protein
MRRSLFGHRDARRLWLAGAFLSAAMWMLNIAAALHVLAAAGTGRLALVQLAGTLPALLLMPVAGLAADRLPVRGLALGSAGVQAAAAAGMALSSQAGDLRVFAALFALQGTAMAFWAPARQQWPYGVLKDSVAEPELRQRANAAIGSVNGAMIVVGAVGAGLVSVWSPAGAIGVTAALTALAFAVLTRVRAPEPTWAGTPNAGLRAHLRSFASGVGEGFAAARRHRLAHSVIWIGIAWGFIGGGYTVMVSGRIVEDIGAGSLAVAIAFTCDGLAVLAATIFAGRLPRRLHLSAWALAYVVQGLGWAAFFLAPGLAGALACLVVMRLASGMIIALDTTLLLETVPAEFRGRVTSVHLTTYNAMSRLSLAALGAALGWAGLTVLGTATGLLSAAFGAVWWFAAGRRVRGDYLAAAGTVPARAAR